MSDISILETDTLDSGIPTAILISLFSDLRATEDETDELDKRGYWGDERLGSKLWLLDRSKGNSETLTKAKQYSEEALAWLVEDGLLDRIDILTYYHRASLIIEIRSIGLRIDYTRKKIL